jgi:hypothetical protein
MLFKPQAMCALEAWSQQNFLVLLVLASPQAFHIIADFLAAEVKKGVICKAWGMPKTVKSTNFEW